MASNNGDIIWSNQEFTLSLSKEDHCGYRFHLARIKKDQKDPTTVIATWVQEKMKTPENVSVFASVDQQAVSLDIIWNSDHFVYRDTATSDGGLQSCNIVLQVSFVISMVYVIWSFGLVLVGEEVLDNLHIFNTANLNHLGYLTIHRNSRESIWVDQHTAAIWCLVRKYDELTKARSTYMNYYRLPRFELLSNFAMPPGFNSYQFVKMKKIPKEETTLPLPTTVTILCTNLLVPSYRLLHFAGPKSPYFEQEFQNHGVLQQRMLRNNHELAN